MRNKLIFSLTAVAASLTMSAPAFAQDTEKAPFDGFYVSGTVGFDAQPNDGREAIKFDKNLDGTYGDVVRTAAGADAFSPGFCGGRARLTANQRCAKDRDNISYSGRIGFDKQFGNIVGGLVAEVGKSEIRDSVSAFSTTPAFYTMTREVDFTANVRARLGFAAKTTLFYATGGPAYARIDHSFRTSNAANAFTGRDGNKGSWGFVAGGGLEQKISRNLSLGVEYLYNRYNDDDYRVRASAGTAPATNPFILAPNTVGTDFARGKFFTWHTGRVTAAFRF